MVGFNRVFRREAGSVSAVIDTYSDGIRISQSQIDMEVCQISHPGMFTAD
jgi:hypothetical protein